MVRFEYEKLVLKTLPTVLIRKLPFRWNTCWEPKSAIVGHSVNDPETNRGHQQQTSTSNVTSNENNSEDIDFDHDILNGHIKRRCSTQHSDITADPLETVSLAFNFLKDEAGSILTDNDANSESVDVEEPDDPPIFRPQPPIPIPRKTEFTRPNHNEIPHSYHQSHSSSKDDLNNYYDRTHYRSQQMSVGYLGSSETDLRYESQPVLSRTSRDYNWPFNGNGAPISNNPLWTPSVLGSQPNLLAPTSSNIYDIHRSHLSSQIGRPMPSLPSQQSYYPNYANNKPTKISIQKENLHRRPGPPPPPPSFQLSNLQKKRSTTLPYPDMQGFILRPSDESSVTNPPYNQRFIPNITRDYRPHSINVNGNSNAMLDVYY